MNSACLYLDVTEPNNSLADGIRCIAENSNSRKRAGVLSLKATQAASAWNFRSVSNADDSAYSLVSK
jgi:hypothetical protein